MTSTKTTPQIIETLCDLVKVTAQDIQDGISRLAELHKFVEDFKRLGEAIYHDEDTGETHCYFCDETMGGEEKDEAIVHLPDCLYTRAKALAPDGEAADAAEHS